MLVFALLAALFAFGALAIHKGWMPGVVPFALVLAGMATFAGAFSYLGVFSNAMQTALQSGLLTVSAFLVLVFYVLAHYPYQVNRKFKREFQMLSLFPAVISTSLALAILGPAAAIGVAGGFLCLAALYLLVDRFLRRQI